MAGRRSTRTTRKPDDDELDMNADEELAEEPDDEFAEEEPDDEPDNELAEQEPDDELAMNADEDELDEEESTQADGNNGRGTRRRPRRADNHGLSAAQAGQAALRQIAELTGKQPEGVTGVEPGEDGWVVGVEVVEDRRIPSSTDILATYETEIDMDGGLLSYQRVRRYPRGRGDEGDS
jgi:gas vesicle protein GvpO